MDRFDLAALLDHLRLTQLAADLRLIFIWAPDWVYSLLVLALAVAVALVAHGIGLRLVRRLFGRRPFQATLIDAIRRPARLAVLALALSVATQVAPLDRGIADLTSQLLGILVVVLIGWMVHVAVRLAALFYLGRFQLDAEDNLLARKHVTQVRILTRAIDTLIVVVTVAAALMTFDAVRQYGVSLFASAGVAGLAVGLAARPLLSNLIAGVQIAMTQPVRLDDVVIVEKEYGRIEEINSTYVVVRLWDLRRIVVPLTYFIETPFENWTRSSAQLLGTVMLHLDHTAPVGAIRREAEAIIGASARWDRNVFNVQVTDMRPDGIEVRVLMSAAHSGALWDLRCEVREKLLDYLRAEWPLALPRRRQEVIDLPEGLRADLRPPAAAGANGGPHTA